MINKKTNKRGDIPITLLVIGIVIICILAIVSFLKSDSEVKGSFSAISTVESAGLVKEKISFYMNLGYNKEEVKNVLNLEEDSRGNLIFKQFDTTVTFPWP